MRSIERAMTRAGPSRSDTVVAGTLIAIWLSLVIALGASVTSVVDDGMRPSDTLVVIFDVLVTFPCLAVVIALIGVPLGSVTDWLCRGVGPYATLASFAGTGVLAGLSMRLVMGDAHTYAFAASGAGVAVLSRALAGTLAVRGSLLSSAKFGTAIAVPGSFFLAIGILAL